MGNVLSGMLRSYPIQIALLLCSTFAPLQVAGMDDSKHGGQTYPEMLKEQMDRAQPGTMKGIVTDQA